MEFRLQLYGGIHFMDAIVNGQQQGKEVANLLLHKYQEHHNNARVARGK
ncbi:MAG: hypothetical protein WD398_05495 [Cyclobacteriaceae bacterium]